MVQNKDKWKNGLARTRKTHFGRLANMLGISDINQATWDELEEQLILADLGVDTTLGIVASMQETAKHEGWIKAQQLKSALHNELAGQLLDAPDLIWEANTPTVVLVVGVNGSGKTTSLAKLGKRFGNEGKKVVLAAADTFRAAAVDQLKSWGKRLDLRVVAGQPEGDAGAVVFDAIKSAVARKDDIVLVDTAGRMHTSYNLMEELKKVQRVAGIALPGAPHATWLVMDATTGQNALLQAKAFGEAVDVTGIILAKLDSSAKGGMAFAIRRELGLPILYVGLGEGEDDLKPFDKDAFVDGVLTEHD